MLAKPDQTITVLYNGQFYDFITRTKSGYDVTVTDKIVIREIFAENVYQVSESELDDTGIVLDIGANIGAFSIYCMATGAKQVIAYEPDPDNFPLLQDNVKSNDKPTIKCVNRGVSRTAGTAELWQGQGASFIDGNKNLTPQASKMLNSGDINKAEIVCVSLEECYADNKIANCDVLKVDVEGSEYAIFEGAPPEIVAKARFITMEFHPTDEVTFGKLIAKLSLTHNIHIIGKYNVGGQIYGRRY